MLLLKLSTLVFVTQTLGSPFLYDVPQALSRFVSSASAASSGLANVQAESLEDDDFFKDSEDQQQQIEDSSIFDSKFNKIIQKITSWTNQKTPSKDDDDFDRDFNEDFVEGSGYFYDKPTKKSEKQQANNSINLNPGNIGVFVMELIGSLVGLAYGAAAQLNYPGSTTTSAPR